MSKTRRRPKNKMQGNIDRPVQKAVSQRGKNLSERSASKIGLLAVLLLVVCAMVSAVHWPALSAQALSFDDDQYLVDNLLMQNPGWASARRFLTEVLEPSTVEGYYQPLAMLSLMADYALGGREDNLRPFHRTSLALHVANTALVIVLLYLLFGQALIAAGVGLLFGLHPMTIEPIPWVGERKTLLAAFFALWCLILYVRYTRKSDWRFYIGCVIMYVLALMSKPTSTPLPVLMLLMDYWPLKRLNKSSILEKIPLVAIGGVAAIITYVSQSRTAFATLPSEYSPEHIPLILCHNIIFYLYKIIWPVNLSSHYAYPAQLGLSNPAVLAGVIGTCILIPLLVISLRWTRAALTGWLLFFAAIFPTMGVVGFTMVIASDKFAYLPSVGLLMALASLLGWFCGTGTISKPMARRTAVVITVLILAGAEATAARRHLVHWRDTVSLCKHMLTLTPHAAPVHNMLGAALKSQGRLDEAISHYRQALQVKPDHVRVHYNLGNALQSQGKLDEAISHYRQAVQVKPDYAKAYNNLGIVLGAQDKFDEAISQFRQAVQVKPNYAPAHYNLGLVLTSQNKLDEAVNHYRQVTRLVPGYAPAHYNLGLTLRMTGQLDGALKHFREAIRLKPNYLAPLNELAWILATHPDIKLRDTSGAIALAERAAKLTRYQSAPILDTLAASYASAGQFDRAITTAQAAITLASATQDDELANHIRKRLELYRQAKPYREPV